MSPEGKTLDKVRKLLSQAESCSKFGTPEGDHEAESFMSKAQEMITEYAISEAMLNVGAKVREVATSTVITILPSYARDKVSLLHIVASQNRVRIVFEMIGKGKAKVTCVGFPTDLESVELLFTSLSLQMTNEVLNEHYVDQPWPGGSVDSARRNFFSGYTARIVSRLREAAKVAEATVQASSGTSVALVLRDRMELVTEKYRELFPNTTKSRRNFARNPEAERAGYDAGGRANLGQPGLRSQGAISR